MVLDLPWFMASRYSDFGGRVWLAPGFSHAVRILLLALLMTASDGAAAGDRPARCASVSAETCALAAAMGRGVNLGGMLDAPFEGDWGVGAEPALLTLAAQHFKTVRVPVRWSNHASQDAQALLDASFVRRVDQVVDTLLDKGMIVVLNVHNYSQLSGLPLNPKEFAVQPDVVEERFLNIWRQIGKHYAQRSSRLIFELYNEPAGRRLDGDPWNQLSRRALSVVRETNPARTVVIGPSDWNNVNHLRLLKLPADRNLLVTFHSYEPIEFTHQGASWVPVARNVVGMTCCSLAQSARIKRVFDTALQWSEQQGVPIFLGEFGTYPSAPMASRVAYARLVRQLAEERAIPWVYWELANAFGLYSPKDQAWRDPLRAALLD